MSCKIKKINFVVNNISNKQTNKQTYLRCNHRRHNDRQGLFDQMFYIQQKQHLVDIHHLQCRYYQSPNRISFHQSPFGIWPVMESEYKFNLRFHVFLTPQNDVNYSQFFFDSSNTISTEEQNNAQLNYVHNLYCIKYTRLRRFFT